MTNAIRRALLALAPPLVALLAAAMLVAPARADTPIVLDSEFGDWVGQSLVSDPFDDSTGGSRRDIHQFYWANGPTTWTRNTTTG